MIPAARALVLIVFATTVVQAQSPLDRYAVDVWTTDDGLPQNSVNAIAQTPDGWLIVGTSGGLARFDGMRFTPIERRDSAGAHLDRVVAFSSGSDGALWIATENGLVRYHEGRFTAWREAEGLPGTVVGGVHADRDGTVWLIVGNRLVRFSGGVFTPMAPPGPNWPIRRDGQGTLWYGPAPRGGLRGTDTVPLPAGADRFLAQVGGDRWFATQDRGLLRAGERERRWPGPRVRLGSAALARDGAGDYWIGATAGIRLFLPDGGDQLVWPVTLPGVGENYDVRTLFVDAEGTLWGGTNGHGLVRIARSRFRVFAERDGLGRAQMTAVMEDRAGRMVFGTNCDGLWVLNPGATVVTRFPWPRAEHAESCPMALAESADGALWIGSYGPLVRIRNGASEQMRFPDGRPLGLVHALFPGQDGTMWAGTLNNGLVAVRPDGTLREYRRADGLVSERVLFVLEDAQGVIWMGTPGGLGRLEHERVTWYTADDGLPSDHVRAVYQDAEGVHWIGTYGGGLARLASGRFTTVTQRDGLADDVVSSILDDGDGHFWMTGNRGVQRVRRADLVAFADGRIPRVHAALFDRSDGLLSAETNGGFQPAAWRARDGRLWFPTVRGVAVVNPQGRGMNGPPPRAAIEAVLVDGTPIADGPAVRLAPGRRLLELRYTGLTLVAPEHIAFRHRLAGFESSWQAAGTRRQAFYPRLPPGRYRFEVQAANRDGGWGEATVLPVRALPLVWETAWFRLLALFIVLGGTAWGVRHRFALLKRERERGRAFTHRFIEGQEAERKRLAGDLHDSIGQGLLVAKNRATLALRSPEVSATVRGHLEEIASVVVETLEAAREISHNLRPHELDRLGLATAIRTAVEQASGAETLITAEVHGVDDVLPPDAEINVYRIVQEALSNILKHARATGARVALTREAAGLRLLIADNGVGFQADVTTGFGLAGLAQRTELLGGELTVRSAPGSGAVITVTIPVHPA